MAYFECRIGGSGDGSTLTVTCYSGFAGLTISITNGVDTFSDVCPSTSPYEVVFDGLANGTWTLSTVYNGDTYTQIVEINAVTQFYPVPDGATATPTDDIQTWLFCASIFDKNYTSIAQVLADASTLQALIASNNAVDYMARSTTWASDVCANSNAMTYIGANDYCADKLLANSTWLNAICNSTYFESVLNVKVPTMTSLTTPSGVSFSTAIYSGNPSYESWKAFDGNDSVQAIIQANAGFYIGYQFTSNKKIYMAKMLCNDTINPNVLQALVNGAWVNISESFNRGATWTTVIATNPQVSTSFRVYYQGSTVAGSGAIYYTLQFYGRNA